MPYRISPDAGLDTEIKRIAGKQLGKAAAILENRPDGLHEAIHEARKKFKRVRNLYRLVSSSDKAFQRQENARLRDAAASLSVVRDAAAIIETVDHLADYTLTEEEAETLAAARTVLLLRRDEIASSETDLLEKVQAAAAECHTASAALEHLKLPSKPGPAARLLAKGWRKGLQRASEALEFCQGEGHGEAFHDLRKAAQAYWMNLSLLRELWPSAFAAKRRDAKRLVDLLGHEHDLSVLTALLDQEPEIFGAGEGLSFLLAIIIRRQQDLRREALELASDVFADSARDEAAVIETLWTSAAIGGKSGHA